MTGHEGTEYVNSKALIKLWVFHHANITAGCSVINLRDQQTNNDHFPLLDFQTNHYWHRCLNESNL